jgi:hypothetical protein
MLYFVTLIIAFTILGCCTTWEDHAIEEMASGVAPPQPSLWTSFWRAVC